jgi:hypothetical protein
VIGGHGREKEEGGKREKEKKKGSEISWSPSCLNLETASDLTSTGTSLGPSLVTPVAHISGSASSSRREFIVYG